MKNMSKHRTDKKSEIKMNEPEIKQGQNLECISKIIEVTAGKEFKRLDTCLKEKFGHSKSFIQKAIENEKVKVNGTVCTKKSTKIKPEDNIIFQIDEPQPIEVVPEDIPIDIVYEDKYFAVINKKAGMVVHPAPGHYTGTLVNALMYHIKDLSGINGRIRPGILHRLDKDTTGLMVVAKNDKSHRSLANQLRRRKMFRKYKTFVWGKLPEDEGVINTLYGRHPVNRKQMTVLEDKGKTAETIYKVLKDYKYCQLAECRLVTGRTHQIRVHMRHLNHPVIGDPQYGLDSNFLNNIPTPLKSSYEKMIKMLGRQALHAYYLSFTHPVSKEVLEFTSEFPVDMKKMQEFLESL